MVSLTSEEIKKVELKLIKDFHEICVENHFNYSICGGTLIGAVRHKGFIPWDDDIDVFMPRKDFDAFINFCYKNKTTFGVLYHKFNTKYYDGIAKIYDKSTIINDNMTNFMEMGLGVFVDIFPIDGAGNSYKEALKNYNSTRLFREILVAKRWNKYRRSRNHSIVYEPFRFALFIISRFINTDKLLDVIDDKYRCIPFESSKYSVSLYGSYRKKEIIPSCLLREYISLEFEGTFLHAIKFYDDYLRRIYGDYMELPPIEKQVTRHGFEAYWLE